MLQGKHMLLLLFKFVLVYMVSQFFFFFFQFLFSGHIKDRRRPILHTILFFLELLWNQPGLKVVKDICNTYSCKPFGVG